MFDTGGERYPMIAGQESLDFVAFFHTPHYVVVEAAALVQVRVEPGRAPASARIDDDAASGSTCTWSVTSAHVVSPPPCSTIGGGAIFLALCYLLHRRERILAREPGVGRSRWRGPDQMAQYLPVVMLMMLAIVFGVLSFTASRLLAPRRPSIAKEAPYECGIVPTREPPERFPVSFYIVAMLFIMFDIEIIFVYPYAVSR